MTLTREFFLGIYRSKNQHLATIWQTSRNASWPDGKNPAVESAAIIQPGRLKQIIVYFSNRFTFLNIRISIRSEQGQIGKAQVLKKF